MQPKKPLETIFVQIASYRDPECQPTVKDLFEKAAYPERIFVGICWQYDPKLDGKCFEMGYPCPEQVRIVSFNWRESEGVCWARQKTQELWRSEDYTLQIDSHMRFAPGWDEKLIEELKACSSKKPVLSGGLGIYTPPDTLERNPMPSVLRSGFFDEYGNIRNRGSTLSSIPDKPLNGAFIAAGFLFARSDIIREVPYDPYLYFDQEEIAYAMRLYTHGWDIFSSRRPYLYHHYIKPDEPVRPMHWTDLKKANRSGEYNAMRARALKRFNHLSGYEKSDDAEVLKEIEKYGLGKTRSLKDYEAYCGIDFKEKKVTDLAVKANFIDGLERYLPYGVFVPELDDPKQSPPDSYAGAGSPPNGLPPALAGERIFVSIASYRDPECQYTVKDLFEKALHPERVSVGICWHYDEKEDKHCFAVSPPYPKQVRTKRYHYSKARGLNWARAEALKLRQGEEYVLQLDAHMRFEPGWDVLLLDMLKRCPSEKPLISSYLPSYSAPNQLQRHGQNVTRISIDRMAGSLEPGIVHLAGGFIPPEDERNGLYPTPIAVFNFLFAPASAFTEVPHDPFIAFHGDEISHSARLYTHGWDIFQPDRLVAYHRWVGRGNTSNLGASLYKRNDSELAQLARVRLRHLLGIEYCTEEKPLQDLDKYGHGTVRTLEDYWHYLGVDPDAWQASEAAKEGYWQVPEEKASRAGEKQRMTEKPRIFVQIASYRDPDCQNTVRDLFEKAADPDRIFVGICWQSIASEDRECFQIETRPEQVRTVHFDARESKGCCWARHEVQKLWQGEEYTLQIDAHMRFEQDWDETMLAMLRRCDSPKPVISSYPPGFEPPHKINHHYVSGLRASHFNEQHILYLVGSHIKIDKLPQKPQAGAFIGACFIFADSSFIQEVPYDPHLYFFGEEITLAVRAWTKGWDIFQPNKPVIYHDWVRKKRKATHFSDHKDWQQINKISFARVRHILGAEESDDPNVLTEIERYGLGDVRPLHAYERFAGVRFATHEIGENAARGKFPAPLNQEMRKIIGKPNKKDGKGVPRVEAMDDAKPATVKLTQVRQEHLPDAAPSAGPHVSLHTGRNSGPVKVFESKEAIVYDDFLPEEIYERLFEFAQLTDYKYINTGDKISRVWNIDNGFPLRSTLTENYHARPKKPKPEFAYPTGKPFDAFIEHINDMVPQVQHIVGEPEKNWEHFSVTSWLYPPNSGLSLHDDGAGIYSGAYVYFMNPEWRLHWGGLLLMLDAQANQAIRDHKKHGKVSEFYKKKWLHASEHNDYAMESGFAQCIFPKRNRMVFIAPDAYHMVTKVNTAAGDNVRMSLAGFFSREKKEKC